PAAGGADRLVLADRYAAVPGRAGRTGGPSYPQPAAGCGPECEQQGLLGSDEAPWPQAWPLHPPVRHAVLSGLFTGWPPQRLFRRLAALLPALSDGHLFRQCGLYCRDTEAIWYSGHACVTTDPFAPARSPYAKGKPPAQRSEWKVSRALGKSRCAAEKY